MPQPPPEGADAGSDRPPPAPTMPGLDKSFFRLALWQPGQAGVRWAVTNASNVSPQSVHRYSKMGMAHS